MKSLNKIKFILFALLILSISCSKNPHKDTTLHYTVIDSIRVDLDATIKIYSLNRTLDQQFVCIDFYDRFSIYLFDEAGNLLSVYAHKGEGPGEIKRAQILNTQDNYILVIDNDNSKIIILKAEDNRILFDTEFKIKQHAMDIALLADDRLLVSHLGEENVYLYDRKGKIINSFSIDSKSNISSMNEYLSTALSVKKFPDSNRLSFANMVTGNLFIANFVEDDFTKIIEIKPNSKLGEGLEVISAKENEHTTINMDGIKSHQCLSGITIASIKNAQHEDIFDIYDSEGLFLHHAVIDNWNNPLNGSLFSNDLKTIWLSKADILLFIARKK